MARIQPGQVFRLRPFAIQLRWNCAFDFSFSALASFFPRPANGIPEEALRDISAAHV
jgi:hypothetical protein